MTNWHVGKRIKEDILFNQRAEYGKQVLRNLSARLIDRYGSGWSVYKLQYCVRAAYTFSEEEIVYATRTQLNWTHLRSLMGIKDPLERQFYAQMCSIEHWDTRTLDEKIDQQLYQRSAITLTPKNGTPVTSDEKPEETPEHEPTKHVENFTKGLRVTFPDGTVICKKTAIDTMIAVLQKVGLDRIPQVGITRNGYNLVGRMRECVNALVKIHEVPPWCAVGLADWYAVSSADNYRWTIAEGSPKKQ